MDKMKKFFRAFYIELKVLKREIGYVLKHRKRRLDNDLDTQFDNKSLLSVSRSQQHSFNFLEKLEDDEADGGSSSDEEDYVDIVDEKLE